MKMILLAMATLSCTLLSAQLTVTSHRLSSGTGVVSAAYDMTTGANNEEWFASNSGIRIRNANGNFRGVLLGIDTRRLAQHNNNVWAATYSNGVFIYVNGVSTNTPTQYLPAQTGLPNISSMVMFNNKICVGGSNGLAYLDLTYTYMPPANTNWTPVPNAGSISAMYADAGQVWVATASGVFTWIPGSAPQPYPIPALPRNTQVNDLFAEPNGALWLATTTGLYRHQNGNTQAFGLHSGFRSANITAVGADAQGNIWAGTAGNIYRRTYNGWATNSLIQLPGGETVHFIRNFSGISWIGTSTRAISLNHGFGRNLVVNGSFEDLPYSLPYPPVCIPRILPSPFDMCAWNGPTGPNSYVNGWAGHPSLGLPFVKNNGVYLLNKKFSYRARLASETIGCNNYCGLNLPHNTFGSEVNAYKPGDQGCMVLDGGSGMVASLSSPLAAKLYEMNVLVTFYSCDFVAGKFIGKDIKLEITPGYLDAGNQFVPVLPMVQSAPLKVNNNGHYWTTGDVSFDFTRVANPAGITHFKVVNNTPSGNENLGRIYIDQFCLRERPAVVPRFNSYTETVMIGCSDSAFIGPEADGPGNLYSWAGNPDASPYNRQVYVRVQPGQTRNFGLTIIRADQYRTTLDTLAAYSYVVTRLPGLAVTVNKIPGASNSVTALDPVVTGGSGNYTYLWTRPGNWGTVSTRQFPGNLLCRGSYTLLVTDVATGCSTTVTYNFNEASYSVCTRRI